MRTCRPGRRWWGKGWCRWCGGRARGTLGGCAVGYGVEGESGRWRTTTMRRWKTKGSWGPADEAWGKAAWWKPPLS
uniref:Uncharacterized protein n=1 Tax=Arundo donax TaxID=35708 RepID=A0A0A9F050_ARUDO